jgi:hypothetical protein
MLCSSYSCRLRGSSCDLSYWLSSTRVLALYSESRRSEGEIHTRTHAKWLCWQAPSHMTFMVVVFRRSNPGSPSNRSTIVDISCKHSNAQIHVSPDLVSTVFEDRRCSPPSHSYRPRACSRSDGCLASCKCPLLLGRLWRLRLLCVRDSASAWPTRDRQRR